MKNPLRKSMGALIGVVVFLVAAVVAFAAHAKAPGIVFLVLMVLFAVAAFVCALASRRETAELIDAARRQQAGPGPR